MKQQKRLSFLIGLIVLTLSFSLTGKASSGSDGAVATARVTASSITWAPTGSYASIVLTVATPEGEVIRKEYKGNEQPSFSTTDGRGAALPDGVYQYELRAAPEISAEVRGQLAKAREDGTDQEVKRDLLRRGLLPKEEPVQSGAFSIIGGSIRMGGETETTKRVGAADPKAQEELAYTSTYRPFTNALRPVSAMKPAPGALLRPARRSPSLISGGGVLTSSAALFFDQVIPDDLIVQGSGCFGFDCVNNESFGFDTIRLKENNLRIKFEDTSVGTFPTNDWQLTANDSASGGASKFSIEDITGSKVPFTITAGAPTNSMFVDSSGRLGLGTSTPGVKFHETTTDTPAIRMEQTNGGGFTAQTWDIGANEANFFVRDLTGGSKLSLRIRPGAPTSSLDIAADGRVGLGIASPAQKLHIVESGDLFTFALIENTTNGAGTAAAFAVKANTAGSGFNAHADARTVSRFGVVLGGWAELLQTAGNGQIVGTLGNAPLILGTNSANRIHITGAGNIGLGGLMTPSHPIHHQNGAHLTAGGVWTNASSRALKTNIHNLSAGAAFKALMQLNPVQFEYKSEPGENYVGFIAEDVPELVATSDRKSLSSMNVVAVLTRVVQEQQKTIAELKEKVLRMEARKASTRRKVRR